MILSRVVDCCSIEVTGLARMVRAVDGEDDDDVGMMVALVSSRFVT